MAAPLGNKPTDLGGVNPQTSAPAQTNKSKGKEEVTSGDMVQIAKTGKSQKAPKPPPTSSSAKKPSFISRVLSKIGGSNASSASRADEEPGVLPTRRQATPKNRFDKPKVVPEDQRKYALKTYAVPSDINEPHTAASSALKELEDILDNPKGELYAPPPSLPNSDVIKLPQLEQKLIRAKSEEEKLEILDQAINKSENPDEINELQNRKQQISDGIAKRYDTVLSFISKNYTFEAAAALRERGGIQNRLQNLKELSSKDPVLAEKYAAIEASITERNQLYANYDTSKLNDVNTCVLSILDRLHAIRPKEQGKSFTMLADFQKQLQGKSAEEAEAIHVKQYSIYQGSSLGRGDDSYDKGYAALLEDHEAATLLAQLSELDPAMHEKFTGLIDAAKQNISKAARMESGE